MRRSASLLATVMAGAFASALLASSPSGEAAGGNCQSKLVGNAYDCTYEFPTRPPVTDCVNFLVGGITAHFDSLSTTFGEAGCDCLSTGSFKSPSFDASPTSFVCVNSGTAMQFTGKVSNTKLSGQGSDSLGDVLVFSCTKRSSAC